MSFNNPIPLAVPSGSAPAAAGAGQVSLIGGDQAVPVGQTQQEPGALLRPEQLQPRPLGLHQFFDNEKLSDIIIRYGAHGEKTFHGHKVVLASTSSWFLAAFTNSEFIEANSNEITLHDDDDDALLQMLKACYLPDNKYHRLPPWPAERIAAARDSNKFILFHISMYTVVDKYQAPKIREVVLQYVQYWLSGVLDLAQSRGKTPQTVATVGLHGILEKVYEITGHRDSRDPLRKVVLDVIMGHPVTKPVNATMGMLVDEVVRIAAQIPDFGRDMFLRTMKTIPARSNADAYLAVVAPASCQNCGSTWMQVLAIAQAGCMFCGN